MKKFLRYFYVLVLFFSLTFVFYGCSPSAEEGFSAYDIAVKNGFVGTEQDWLESLFIKGDSAYDIAVKNGFVGSEEEWLASLVANGKSAYDVAVENGFVGSEAQWLDSLYVEGDSAYKIAQANGFVGSENDWLASLKGASAYDLAVENGFVGNVASWLASLVNVEIGDGTELSEQGLFELGVALGEYTNDSEGYAAFCEDIIFLKVKKVNTLVERQVTAKLLNQVVAIYTDQGAGAGVVYEINKVQNYAYLITNYHVVILSSGSGSSQTYTPAQDIYVYTYGMQIPRVLSPSNEYDFKDSDMKAEYVGGSAAYDLAVVKISGESFDKFSATSAMEITFADTTNLQPRTTAIAVGNPIAEGIAVTTGVVSVPSENVVVDIAGAGRNLRCLRMDTAINGGNSGGGVFDGEGRLIGIANAKYASSVYENIANAILATNVKNVTENIIYFYEKNLADDDIVDKTVGIHRFTIGITSMFVNQRSVFDEVNFTNTIISDAQVVEVGENSIAEAVGVKENDFVRGIKVKKADEDEEEFIYFNMIYELTDYMLTVREGDEITLIVLAFNEDLGEYNSSESELAPFTILLEGFTEIKNNAILN